MTKFKKIVSVLATALMLGSTVVAGAYPSPFINNGIGDTAIVTGANAALTDSSAAIDLMNNLNSLVVSTEPIQNVSEDLVFTGDNFLKLEKGSNNFNLGNSMNDFYSRMDDDELPVILKSETYLNSDNDEFDYDQEIVLGDNLTLEHFQDNDFNNEKPTIGFPLERENILLTYTLDFDTAADAGGAWESGNDLESTKITILGNEYYILTARNSTKDNHKITLLDTADTKIVSENTPLSITTGSKTYSVSIDYINDEEVIFNVDSEFTNKLSDGDVYKLEGDNFLAVKNVLYNSKETGISKAEISIGSGEIVLENGSEVEINGDKVSDIDLDLDGSDEEITYSLVSNLVVDDNKLNKIELIWSMDSDAWLSPMNELVMPGFNSIKISMNELKLDSEELTSIEDNSKGFVVKTEITDGNIDIPILYVNGTTIKGIGKDDGEKLVTNSTESPTLNLVEDSYFAATWISGDESETYVYQLDDIDGNKTTLENLAGGKDITIDDIDESETEGEIKYTLISADESERTASIKLDIASSGSVYADRIVTEEGLQMLLPVDIIDINEDAQCNNNLTQATCAVTGDITQGSCDDGSPLLPENGTCIFTPAVNEENVNNGNINLGTDTTWTMNFTEEDNNNNVADGKSFTVGLKVNSEVMYPASIDGINYLETSDDSDKHVGYMVSDLATKIEFDRSGDLNSLEIIYSGEESSADVFISETNAGYVSSSIEQVDNKVIVVKDSEIDSVKTKNLIVVGGSCINTVAANMLGGAYCGDEFTTATNVISGQYLIKTIASPYASDKIAMLVAGYNAADTSAGVQKVKTNISTEVGYSEVY